MVVCVLTEKIKKEKASCYFYLILLLFFFTFILDIIWLLQWDENKKQLLSCIASCRVIIKLLQ